MVASIRLTKAQARVVARCLSQLFSKRALVPKTIEQMRTLPFERLIALSLRISPDGREALMSEACAEAEKRVVDTLVEASLGCDLWTRGDIAQAVRGVYEECWQVRQKPESPEQLAILVGERLLREVDDQIIVAALHGVSLVGVAEMDLGALKLVASAEDLLTQCGVAVGDSLERGVGKRLANSPCLYGRRRGTFNAAKRWYREQTSLAAGMLAVDAGASYQESATSFFIDVGFERPTGNTGSMYLFWTDKTRHLGESISFPRGQHLELNGKRVAELNQPGAFVHAFEIFQKSKRTELEDAITRAVYWYGDAHRDTARVMQFIKYWSCIECLLGGPGEKLTETLAQGVATVLTFGHYRLLDPKDWANSLRTVKRLYALRSGAVHRASHTHVTHQDVVDLGTWAAWVIYNAISLSNAGYPTPEVLTQRIKELVDRQVASGALKPA